MSINITQNDIKTDDVAPVALFAYNRADHLEKTLNALCANTLAPKTKLTIFCDGAKSVSEIDQVNAVRDTAKRAKGFFSVRIVEQDKNQGLATSIISGVSELVKEHGQVIVIEDDIITSPSALGYFNLMLRRYKTHQEIFSISGFNFPPNRLAIEDDYEFDVYAIPRMQCWGWATWQEKWDKADFDMPDYPQFKKSLNLRNAYGNRIGFDSLATLDKCMAGEKDVWACRWVYTHFKHNALCICPVQSLVDNIGLDGSGQNSGKESMYNDVLKLSKNEWKIPGYGFVDDTIFQRFMACFNQHREIKRESSVTNLSSLINKFIVRIRTYVKRK